MIEELKMPPYGFVENILARHYGTNKGTYFDEEKGKYIILREWKGSLYFWET